MIQKILTLLLSFILSGFFSLGTQLALAESSKPTLPTVRHTAPQPDTQNGRFKIKAIIKSPHPLSKITLWYRNKGETAFQKIEMHGDGERRYSADLVQTENGVEYYIEVTDTQGQQARDGQKNKPYFFESSIPEPPPAFQFSTANTETGTTKPFWKKTWFWVAVVTVTVIGGGVALAGSGSDEGQPTGTVTVN